MDTIVAVASPPGGGERAVLRLSGPAALEAAGLALAEPLPRERCQRTGQVDLPSGRVSALALVMPGPGSFTGEDVVELHVPGSSLLCSMLIDQLVTEGRELGVRRAQPGEFSARAFENGRMDLAQAEGLLMLIHGTNESQLAAGAAWLSGGLREGLRSIREKIQDGLAWIETGLDFEPEDTGAVDASHYRPALEQAQAELDRLLAAVPRALPGGELLLVGASNAGKSSLVNALAGRDEVLVDPGAGTTRDVLRVELAPGVAVWDAPGDLDQPAAIDAAALQLRDRLGAQAAAALVVVDSQQPVFVEPSLPVLGVVLTKCDLGPPAASLRGLAAAEEPVWVCSATQGTGIDELRAFLVEQSAGGAREPGWPVRAAAEAARDSVARVLSAPPELSAELLGAELQQALAELAVFEAAEQGGSHSAEPLLDRIFRRFCLGK
ncbi:MAG: GTPase [Planctomycetota bacterium]|nr:GTPase [Planctomycetota bacterium]